MVMLVGKFTTAKLGDTTNPLPACAVPGIKKTSSDIITRADKNFLLHYSLLPIIDLK